jgi:CheY-like chemotaxis protein/HPt (histidine-containing phosphotransfer) domain-containing protein
MLVKPNAGLRESTKPGPRFHVLVAEDNPINQRVLVRILAKQDHAVVVVGNGRQASAALAEQAFDLILMDVDMPEMDGLQATAAIREQEKGTGRHVPVIAVTTHALDEDRARCRAAGMDAHVAKPVRAGELLRAIADLLGRAGGAPAPPPQGPPAEEVLDRAELLDRVDGDREFLAELVQMFAEDCPGWLAAIRDSIDRGDARGLKLAAHTLRGAAANFSARAAADAAGALEGMGRAGDLTGAAAAYAILEDAVRRLGRALAGFVGPPASYCGEFDHDGNARLCL